MDEHRKCQYIDKITWEKGNKKVRETCNEIKDKILAKCRKNVMKKNCRRGEYLMHCSSMGGEAGHEDGR
jgi:hypothetical protein